MKKKFRSISGILSYVFLIGIISSALSISASADQNPVQYKVVNRQSSTMGIYGDVQNVYTFKDCSIARTNERIFLIKHDKVVKDFEAKSFYCSCLGRKDDEVILVNDSKLAYINVKNETIRMEDIGGRVESLGIKLELIEGTIDNEGNKWISCGYVGDGEPYEGHVEKYYKLLRVDSNDKILYKSKPFQEIKVFLGNDKNNNLVYAKNNNFDKVDIEKVDKKFSVNKVFSKDLNIRDCKFKLDKEENYWFLNQEDMNNTEIYKINSNGSILKSFDFKDSYIKDLQTDEQGDIWILNHTKIEKNIHDKFTVKYNLKESFENLSVYDDNNLTVSEYPTNVGTINNGQYKKIHNKEMGMGKSPKLINDNEGNIFLYSEGNNDKMNFLQLKEGKVSNENLLDVDNETLIDFCNGYFYTLNKNTLTKFDKNFKFINKISLDLSDDFYIFDMKVSKEENIYLTNDRDIKVFAPNGKQIKQIDNSEVANSLGINEYKVDINKIIKDSKGDLYISYRYSNSRGEEIAKVESYDKIAPIVDKSLDYNGFFFDEQNNIGLYKFTRKDFDIDHKETVDSIIFYKKCDKGFIVDEDLQKKITLEDAKDIFSITHAWSITPYIKKLIKLNDKIIIESSNGIYVKDNKGKLQEVKFTNEENEFFEYRIDDIGKCKDGRIYIINDGSEDKPLVYLGDDESKAKISFKGYKRLPASNNVDKDKEWTINLSKAAKNDNSMLKECVKVMDDYGNEVECVIKLQSNGQKVQIKPLVKYESGQVYHIIINKNIKSEDGDIFEQSVEKEFTIHK